MTMTSFPWENKSSSSSSPSYPWEKREAASSFPWQNRTDPASSSYKWQTPAAVDPPTYHWQSAAPPPAAGKFPWEAGSSGYTGTGYAGSSGYTGTGYAGNPGYAENPGYTGNSGYTGSSGYVGNSSYGGTSHTNPLDAKKHSFPWEKSSVTSSSGNDLFVFGKEEPKKTAGTYSSFYSDQLRTEREPPGEKSTPSVGAGSYSSIYNKGKSSLFPWEKKKEGEDDSLEAQLSEYLKLSTVSEAHKQPEYGTDNAQAGDKSVKQREKAEEDKVPLKSPKTKKKSSPKKSPKAIRKKSASSKEETSPKKELAKFDEQNTNIEIKVPSSETQEDKLLKEERRILEGSTKAKAATQKSPEGASEEKAPITSPKGPLSRTTSLTKLATKTKPDRIKSAPPVPSHINKKSEMLARNYMSAYAKPKIAPKKKEAEKKEEEEKPRLGYRREESISEWVYPAPTEPVDWKTRSEQGLPPAAAAPPSPDITTQSELNLDSTSLREAAFKKWITKKKENKTFKKSDLVTVIKDRDDMPSAEEIRQEKFEEWYRSRAIEVDKKAKELSKEEERKLKEAEEEKEEKTKNEALARRLWEEKDQERKRKIRGKKAEEEKTKLEKEKELKEKKKNAEKTFNSWKNDRDPKLKEEAKKKKLEEKLKKEEERDEKEMKEIEGQKSFKAWKEAKDQESRDKKAEAEYTKRQKEQEQMREKREKEAARARAVQEWNAQKEREKCEVVIPQHVTPWKNGPGKNAVISRDEMLMANIKHKKNRQSRGSVTKSAYNSETVTEVEFVK